MTLADETYARRRRGDRRQRGDAPQEEVAARLLQAGEHQVRPVHVEVDRREDDPPSDRAQHAVAAEVARAVEDDRDQDGGEEDRELGAQQAVVDQRLARDRRREEERDLGLAERSPAVAGGADPGVGDPDEADQAEAAQMRWGEGPMAEPATSGGGPGGRHRRAEPPEDEE
jgi:hypothetical protein